MKRKRRKNGAGNKAREEQETLRRQSSSKEARKQTREQQKLHAREQVREQARGEVEYRSGNSARTRKRRLSPWRITIFIFVVMVVIALVIGTFMIFNNPNALGDGSPIAVFGVKNIQVEGVTKYEAEAVIEKSGIKLGQSVFSVDKKKASTTLLSSFSYFSEITISSPSFNVIKITAVEAVGTFVVENGSHDVILAKNGKAVEIIPAGGEVSKDYYRVLTKLDIQADPSTTSTTGFTTGATDATEMTSTTTVSTDETGPSILEPQKMLGKIVIDDRVEKAINTIVQLYPDKITYIDATNLTTIKIRWNDQISIILGSDYKIDEKIKNAYFFLDKALEEYGAEARGTLTVLTTAENGVVFTPDKPSEPTSETEPNPTS